MKTKLLDVSFAAEKFANETKVKGQSVKGRLEQMLDDTARAFYQECADIEGISLDEWLSKADKGEF